MRGKRDGGSCNCSYLDTLNNNSAVYLSIHIKEVNMKRIVAVAFALSIAAPAAIAQPVQMSDAQLDQVTGGLADVSVSLTNAGNPNVTLSPSVQANPNVNVSVSVLGL
jgi:hypothetical protein